jgi:hypothetical protein
VGRKNIEQMKNIFITVLLIFNWCYSDQELTGGLKFYSNYEKPGVGSKLVLPTKGEFNLTKPFSIIFELSIAPTSPYGIILQARNGHETIFSVSYIDFQSEDSSFINLVYGDKDTGIRIPILKDELSVDNWMKLNIEIDPISNSIKLTLNEQLFKNSEIEIRHPLTFNWVFGKPINRNDVPAMGIRDVKFFIEGVEKNYWPLNEFRSEKAKDIVGKKDGVQAGCLWLNSKHQNWILIKSLPKSDIELTDFNLKSYERVINVDNKLAGIITDKNEIHLEFLNIKPLPEKFIHYFNNGSLLSFHAGGKGPISVYDDQIGQWSEVDTTKSNNQLYNSTIIKDVHGDLYQFGGYGHYSVRNQLLKYDWDAVQWDTISYTVEKNEEFHPRDKMTYSMSADSTFYWIFGGEGNVSGKQEDGFHTFFDLWKLDLQNKQGSKMWKWDGQPELQVVDMKVFGDTLLTFLTIDQLTHQVRFFYSSVQTEQIYELSPSQIISPNHQAMLVPSPDEYYLNLLIENETTIEIYQLAMPPVYIENRLEESKKRKYFGYLVIIFLMISVTYVLYKQKNTTQDKEIPILISLEYGTMELFINGEKRNLEKVKLKKAIHLLKLIAETSEQKITHHALQGELWPHVMDESFTNSLNVAIHECRKLISPYGDQLINQNKTISLKCKILYK